MRRLGEAEGSGGTPPGAGMALLPDLFVGGQARHITRYNHPKGKGEHAGPTVARTDPELKGAQPHSPHPTAPLPPRRCLRTLAVGTGPVGGITPLTRGGGEHSP
jgi:hypothetical protein